MVWTTIPKKGGARGLKQCILILLHYRARCRGQVSTSVPVRQEGKDELVACAVCSVHWPLWTPLSLPCTRIQELGEAVTRQGQVATD